MRKFLFQLLTGRCYKHRDRYIELRLHKKMEIGDGGIFACPVCEPLTEEYYVVGKLSI